MRIKVLPWLNTVGNYPSLARGRKHFVDIFLIKNFHVGTHPYLDRGRKPTPYSLKVPNPFCSNPPNPREGTETLNLLRQIHQTLEGNYPSLARGRKLWFSFDFVIFDRSSIVGNYPTLERGRKQK